MTSLFICKLRLKLPASSCRWPWNKNWARPADKWVCRTS